VALKLVVTTVVRIKLVINLWRFAPPESGEKLLQEATSVRDGRICPVAKTNKTFRHHKNF